MKKLIFVLLFIFFSLMILSVFSCKKEEGCNCGLILDDDVTTYSIKIRNDCTNNEAWFTLQPGDWIHAHPGEHYCITNVTSW